MSSLASFYLVRSADVQALRIVAQQPIASGRRKVLGLSVQTGKPHDPFFEFLRTHTQKLAELNGSGELITTLALYLEEFALDMAEFADRDLSDLLMRVRGTYMLVFREPGAARLKQTMALLNLDESKLGSFLARSSDAPDGLSASALLDALGTLQAWLSQVDAEHAGLLVVG